MSFGTHGLFDSTQTCNSFFSQLMYCLVGESGMPTCCTLRDTFVRYCRLVLKSVDSRGDLAAFILFVH
jgi:hypothetical protein